MFQSTRPHGARLGRITEREHDGKVSIHAPARGATNPFPHDHDEIEVSIHAPARGATDYQMREWFKYAVSIHAPARGATAW